MTRRKSAAPAPVLTGPKSEQLKILLASAAGETVTNLATKLGWQPHTTRAALTRLKQAGITVEKMEAADGTRQSRYRISSNQK